ncbi:hypothetical protein C8R46DRAFT_1235942 [Mycena filopes]|nr:hypothetical protein C8R46DRAFT_1235942 [Mycena filopes]
MFNLKLALVALGALVASTLLIRDVEPAIDDLRLITKELLRIGAVIGNFTANDVVSLQASHPRSYFVLFFLRETEYLQEQFIDMHFANVSNLTTDAAISVDVCVSQNGVADESDAEEVLEVAEEGYVPTLLDVLNKTVNARGAFGNTPGAVPIILKDLQKYSAANALYLANFTAGTPTNLLPTVRNITANISMAFARAIAAYSSPPPPSCPCPNLNAKKRWAAPFNMADLSEL